MLYTVIGTYIFGIVLIIALALIWYLYCALRQWAKIISQLSMAQSYILNRMEINPRKLIKYWNRNKKK